jgi:hypothetical protein
LKSCRTVVSNYRALIAGSADATDDVEADHHASNDLHSKAGLDFTREKSDSLDLGE